MVPGYTVEIGCQVSATYNAHCGPDEDLSKLSRYYQADEVKIKSLNLALVKG